MNLWQILILFCFLPQGNNGYKAEYYLNGKMKTSGIFINSAKEGKWREWYDENRDGRDVYFMLNVGIFHHGLKDSFWMERQLKDSWPLSTYIPDNVPVWIEGYYINGKRDGLWKEYVMDEKPYYAKHKNWNDRGKLAAQVNYVNGKIDGECIRNWWGNPKSDTIKNGSITITMKDGQFSGSYQNLYNEKSKNHTLIRIESGNYENNMKTGVWTVYNELRVKKMGTVIAKYEQNYKDNKPDGLPVEYYFKDGKWMISVEKGNYN